MVIKYLPNFFYILQNNTPLFTFVVLNHKFYIFKSCQVNKMNPYQQQNDIQILKEKFSKALQQQTSNFEHEKKKLINQMKSDLDFERIRASDFEEKYKNSIKYQNEEQSMKKILNQLNDTIKSKEDQLLEQVKLEQERKRKIAQLQSENEELVRNSEQFKQQFIQIKQGAISAIVQKDGIIADLEERIVAFENADHSHLQNTILELEEKYRDLEQKSQSERRELEGVLEIKDEQVRELREKLDLQRERYDERITYLEQDIASYEKHIDKINEQRHYQQNLQEKYYILEEKHRKSEKKLHDQEASFKNERIQYTEVVQKLENEVASMKEQAEEIKNLQAKLKQAQKQMKQRKKQAETTLQKAKSEHSKKIVQLQHQKKKMAEALQAKYQQLQKIKSENQEKFNTPTKNAQNAQKSPQKSVIDPPNLKSAKKESHGEENVQIEKLKNTVKDQEETIDNLNKRLQQQTKQLQNLRQKLVSSSGSASRSDKEAELMIQIEDLNSHVKKFQHDLLLKKLHYAEDQAHWKSREKELKREIEEVQKKSKKQKAELLERIDRMKKNPKDKKMDYYQSSLK